MLSTLSLYLKEASYDSDMALLFILSKKNISNATIIFSFYYTNIK